ncbi:hypothetical protein OPU71_00720 [Niveibacterium sp. 24ML]|uniref:hypothetical protein n=1 Tax=Niveibacterium sp. 24ML TaxID=2985512 RepID=UPI00226FE405|nr:hypothetical protein [Niveibacterium sp. 24ML]MCX9154640.1 hypothetical protein [Niveibacterium sp. 24ML]
MSRSLKPMIVMLALIGTSSAIAQTYVYPAKGQSAEQQQKDVAECQAWAKQQTGFDPAKPVAAAPAPAPAPSGGRVRGAAAGATVAAITDNDVGDAAAVGAVVGASAQRRDRRQAASQQQAAASQQQAAGQANYAKAQGACLEGRGYTVK